MKKIWKKLVALALVAATAAAATGCSGADADSLKGKRLRVVIGSKSTGGDTYLTADLATRYLSETVECNGKVDAIGANAALEEIITAKPDGQTVMMFHDMTWLGVSFGAYEEKYNLENMIIGPRIGISQGACFAVSASAPYATIKEMAEYLKANPSEVCKVACEAGGVSQLGFNSIYEWVKAEYGDDVAGRIKAFITGDTSAKCQALWDGSCQMIFADISALEQYTVEGVDAKIAMKIAGLMSGQRIEGKDYPTFAEQGITINGEPYAFDKEYSVFFVKGTPQAIIDQVDQAVQALADNERYQEEMAALGFKGDVLSAAENQKHMVEKRDSFAEMIAQSPSLDELTAQ